MIPDEYVVSSNIQFCPDASRRYYVGHCVSNGGKLEFLIEKYSIYPTITKAIIKTITATFNTIVLNSFMLLI